MSNKNWFQGLLENYENDLEYNVEETKLDITEEICEIMEKEGINRKQMATKMGTTPAAITKFLSGYSNLTLKTLVKFSLCLNKKLVFSFKEKEQDTDSSHLHLVIPKKSVGYTEIVDAAGEVSFPHKISNFNKRNWLSTDIEVGVSSDQEKIPIHA